MAPDKLDGPTLGHKHRNYNKIVKESMATRTEDALEDIDLGEDDVSNLIKVDIACVDRNVDYILGILKGNDMLYASRAITRSPWLITDSSYAHIINPEYIHSQLVPVMMPKAANKLMLHVRLNLRDETRVEKFFNYYEQRDLKTALKWLPHCSAAFMKTKVKKYTDVISPQLLKRLCEKSHITLEVYVKSSESGNWGLSNYFQATLFLLNTHRDFYLDLVEAQDTYAFPKFNVKWTKALMNACPERVHQHFSKYARNIDLSTFVKYLNENKIKEFLLTQVNLEKERLSSWMMHYANYEHFIRRMPQEERLGFVRDMFINKRFREDIESDDSSISGNEDKKTSKDDGSSGMKKLYKFMNCTKQSYHWYIFFPFDVALSEIKEKINNVNENDKNGMLECLAEIVGHDLQHLETLLQYYTDNHLKGANNIYINGVVKKILNHTNIFDCDYKCWSLLTKIFSVMNLYTEKTDYSKYVSDDQVFIKAIIVYEVTNKKEVSEIIMKQFDFDTLEEYNQKLNSEKQSLLFDHLYNYLMKKIEKQNYENHTVFEDNVKLIKLVLKLIKDWQRNLADYPYVLNKIKDLIKVKQDNSLKVSLSWIYDINKSWRKWMFEESIILCASERVCVNALKHDPSLLSRNENIVSAMRCNDTVTLRQFLTKIKIYWPDSFASEWSQVYRERLNQPLGHKPLMRGLSLLLSQRELQEIINNYKPDDPKINWEENDEILISLRKHIAMNMHFARPQPSPNDILQYAKGDYLQFALPSLNAIFYNLCAARCEELIPRLLDSPVSLQKHGIRLAFVKMQSEDLQRIFCDYWKTIKNLSIRAVIFKLTYNLLCKENNPAKIDNIWRLLKVFIDALTFEEDKTIYKCLGKVRKVPLRVRPAYVMKSYKFFKSLLPKSDLDKNKYELALDSLIDVINELMELESMDPMFVAHILQEYYIVVYTKDKKDEFIHRDLMPLMASYLTCTESEAVQAQRYKTLLLPLLKHTVAAWAEKDKNDIQKTNLKQLLKILRRKLKDVITENKIVPVAMYADIQKELDQSLEQNSYLMLREWKLTAAFAKVINDSKVTVEHNNQKDDDDYWNDVCMKAAPRFGKMCLELLKEDIKSFFPSIDEYFSKALKIVFEDLISPKVVKEVLKHMLTEDLTQSYLVTIRVLPEHYPNYEGNHIYLELHKKILSHPSLEVKMHFYHKGFLNRIL